ncbi:TetR/AcrR family transcriptional regulator [Hyphomicrobium sp.]|uniref:TetR/AcrR family transcriptional regulator n=1 Tax=Hyphomicrobium sp. TaxID=82 RepID=UPI000F990125|nr:TetR/AcrR family transcriptional regulator [Hyphomicrobium sp.]RUO97251.1 MAG: TetR/AcrR family transcriptional regulator [Hyphomicrobium sp.]
MRVSREVMAQRHDEIISETSKMLRQRGIVGTSLADLMAAAGLTHGGFYKHFDSKDALVAEATERIFAEINARFQERVESQGSMAALIAYVTDYLTLGHVKKPELGCPIPAFGPDVSREHGAVRGVFTNGIKTNLSLIIEGLSGPMAERKEKAVELLSLLSGAVAMARATDDEKLSSEIIASARKRANQIIESPK